MNKKAFTMAELLVTISVLIILGTIAILSYVSYSYGARDAVRVGDLGKLERALNLFNANNLYFPSVSGGSNVTYNGAQLWSQGTFGYVSLRELGNMSEVSIDPQTGNNYSYSRTRMRDEFQIGSIYEGSLSNNFLIDSAQAAGAKKAIAYIKGNYNGMFLRTSTGGNTLVIATPSIVNSDMSITDIEDLISGNKLVYHNYENLPSCYNESSYNTNGGFEFSAGSPLLMYSGNTRTFSSDLKKNESDRLGFVANLQTFYNGSILANSNPDIKNLLRDTIDLPSPTKNQKVLAAEIIDIFLGTNISLTVE